jgi:hypothetical protein
MKIPAGAVFFLIESGNAAKTGFSGSAGQPEQGAARCRDRNMRCGLFVFVFNRNRISHLYSHSHANAYSYSHPVSGNFVVPPKNIPCPFRNASIRKNACPAWETGKSRK